MPRFPYMNFPFPFYKNYSKTTSNYIPVTPNNIDNIENPYYSNNYSKSQNIISTQSNEINSNEPKINRRQNLGFCTDDYNGISDKPKNDYLLDLFGLKIYNDDVLLISLIYFLYTEGVKDDGLFLVLVLLLLS